MNVAEDFRPPERRIFLKNKAFQIHVQKLKEVQGLKSHNLKIEKSLLRNGATKLLYIINPVEAETPNSYLSIDEFKDILFQRAQRDRQLPTKETKKVTSRKKPVTKNTRSRSKSKYVNKTFKQEVDSKVKLPTRTSAEPTSKRIKINIALNNTAKTRAKTRYSSKFKSTTRPKIKTNYVITTKNETKPPWPHHKIVSVKTVEDKLSKKAIQTRNAIPYTTKSKLKPLIKYSKAESHVTKVHADTTVNASTTKRKVRIKSSKSKTTAETKKVTEKPTEKTHETVTNITVEETITTATPTTEKHTTQTAAILTNITDKHTTETAATSTNITEKQTTNTAAPATNITETQTIKTDLPVTNITERQTHTEKLPLELPTATTPNETEITMVQANNMTKVMAMTETVDEIETTTQGQIEEGFTEEPTEEDEEEEVTTVIASSVSTRRTYGVNIL